MTMSISLDAPPSGSISKSDYLSSLPRWRRWLSRLNWHPVVDIEIRSIAREQRMQQLEKEISQLESEILLIKSETEQIKSDNARLDELNAKIAALWPSSNSSSAPLQSTDNDSPT